jgi:hypothetical protein
MFQTPARTILMFPVTGEGEKPSLLYATVAMISYWLCLAALLSPEPSRCFKARVPQTATQLHTLRLTVYPLLPHWLSTVTSRASR